MEQRPGNRRVIDALDRLGLQYDVVRTRPASSAEESAQLQDIALNELLKTIVVRRAEGDYVFVLVPGDREIDWKKLRQALGVSRASIPSRDEAERITGFGVGAITPFGSATEMPVIVDAAALDRPKVALGGGERGVNVHVSPQDLVDGAGARAADVTTPR